MKTKNPGSEKEIADKKAAAEEEKRAAYFSLAHGFVEENELFRELSHSNRMLKVRMLAGWVEKCCLAAIDEAGSYSEGVVEGRKLQEQDDQEQLELMRQLEQMLGREGDQTLVDALEYKLSEENRVLRDEVDERICEARKGGFELGLGEMRLHLENANNREYDALIKRGPDVK